MAAAPLGTRPWLQWSVTVAVALLVYSLAVRAVGAARDTAATSELGSD